MTNKQKWKKIKFFIFIIIIILAYIYLPEEQKKEKDTTTQKKMLETPVVLNTDSKLKIYFIDVGQADSILIANNNKYMLIDAGNNEDGPKLVSYFKNMGIEKFEYVIGTHAHEDHIGGLDDIINNFEISNFYMPDAVTTTKTFEDVIEALENKNLAFKVPEIDKNIKFEDSSINILYSGTDQTNLNDTSIIIKLYYGNTSYLFMGDAPSSVEREIIDKDIKSDVLKVGHHGSKYSTSAIFLSKVKPKFAVISVGKNNIYNHPQDITLNKLQKIGAKIYRTDEDGTIILNSDGKDISFETINTDTNG